MKNPVHALIQGKLYSSFYVKDLASHDLIANMRAIFWVENIPQRLLDLQSFIVGNSRYIGKLKCYLKVGSSGSSKKI